MAKTSAGSGIDFLRLCAEDARLNHSELREIYHFVAGVYSEQGPPDPAMVRASEMLCRMLIESRGKREPGSFSRHPYEGLDQPIGRGTPTQSPAVKATAEQILRAAAKAEGRLVELPPEGSLARQIIAADRRRRNEPEPGGRL